MDPKTSNFELLKKQAAARVINLSTKYKNYEGVKPKKFKEVLAFLEKKIKMNDLLDLTDKLAKKFVKWLCKYSPCANVFDMKKLTESSLFNILCRVYECHCALSKEDDYFKDLKGNLWEIKEYWDDYLGSFGLGENYPFFEELLENDYELLFGDDKSYLAYKYNKLILVYAHSLYSK